MKKKIIILAVLATVVSSCTVRVDPYCHGSSYRVDPGCHYDPRPCDSYYYYDSYHCPW